MDSWEAVIATVFGSLTGSEVAPMLFDALLGLSIAMPIRRKVAAKAQISRRSSEPICTHRR
jgi:hypothetical protein